MKIGTWLEDWVKSGIWEICKIWLLKFKGNYLEGGEGSKIESEFAFA